MYHVRLDCAQNVCLRKALRISPYLHQVVERECALAVHRKPTRALGRISAKLNKSTSDVFTSWPYSATACLWLAEVDITPSRVVRAP